MRNIKGFYRYSSIANNNPNMVATFGEIDRQSLTYTTEDRNYLYSEHANTELVTLQVVDELNRPVQTPDTLMKRITAVGQWLYAQHIAGMIPPEENRELFYTSLITEFSNLSWNGMGAIIRSAENGFFMPTHVEFVALDGGLEYAVKVWTANKNFQEEYEPFTLHIIPPVDDVNQFINNSVTVAGLLGGNTIKNTLAKYNNIRKANPDTMLNTYDLVWHDPTDPMSRLTTTWTYVAYGIAATDIYNIKTAIRNMLANNSDYNNWPAVFPSLFEENDFTIIPLWDRIAVPETQIDQNLYSSFTAVADLKAIATKAVPSSYGSAENIAAHITAHLELVSTFYRGMLLATLGNPSNLDRKLRVSDLFPDYSDVPISADFERMELHTREFAELLNTVLEHARVFSEGDTVPAGFYRVARNNNVYLAFLHVDFQFMVMTRYSYLRNAIGG